MLDPGTDGQKDRAISINMIETILRIVFNDENDRIFPARTVRDELHGQTQRCIVVLDKPGIGPRWSVRVDVERPAAMVVGKVQVYVGGEFTHTIVAVHIFGLEDLLEATKAVEACRIFGQRRIGNMGVVFGVEMVTMIPDDFFHRDIDMLTNAGWLGATVLVNNGEFIAVAEIDEALVVTRQM